MSRVFTPCIQPVIKDISSIPIKALLEYNSKSMILVNKHIMNRIKDPIISSFNFMNNMDVSLTHTSANSGNIITVKIEEAIGI